MPKKKPVLIKKTSSPPIAGAKVEPTAKAQLKASGLAYDNEQIQAIVAEIQGKSNPKFKRHDDFPFSVIVDQNQTPYAIFRGKLGAGLEAKVKLAQNLITKEFVAVKYGTFDQHAHEKQMLIQLGRYRGEQHRLKKTGVERNYLFCEYFPGITMKEFREQLQENNATLTDEQNRLLLISLLTALHKMFTAAVHQRDLHDKNIIIDPTTWQASIIDFGHADDMTYTLMRGSNQKQNLEVVLFLFQQVNPVNSLPLTLQKIINDLKDTNWFIPSAVLAKIGELQMMDLSAADRPQLK